MMASLGPTLPGLARQTGSTLEGISWLFMSGSFGFLLGALLGSRLYDRFEGHRIVAVALAVSALGFFLIPFSPALWMLIVLKLILGFAAGTIDTGVNTLLMWLHGKKVPPYMNALHFCFGLGAFLTPIIVGRVMAATGGIAWAYWILAVVMLPVAAWFVTVPSPPIPAHPEAVSLKRKISPLVMLVAAFFFLYVGAEISFGGWIYTYAVRLDLANAERAAYLTSAFWGAFTVGRLLSIPRAVMAKPSRLLGLDVCCCLASLALILFFAASPTALWIGAIGFGFFMAPIFPTTLSLAERRMHITGAVTGWFFVGASLGAMLMPSLIGQHFETIGPRVAMFVILADMALALVVLAALLRGAARIDP
jgi:FHS family Na+ dependent glucose MFS transporter 1